MFSDDDPFSFKSMQEFSAVDGFLEVAEDLADMIKYVANEPSVGLFYVQKHIQSATPNLVNLKKNVLEISHETLLHTEDLEDSLTMVQSMKECGFPIADELIGEIQKSISIMSRKQPKKGLLSSSRAGSGFIGRTNSWSPAASGPNTGSPPLDNEKVGGYLSGVLKSAKQKVNIFKWPQVEDDESNKSTEVEGEYLSPSKKDNDLQGKPQLSKSLSQQALLSLYENFDEFKADRESKLEEWLGRTGKEEHSP